MTPELFARPHYLWLLLALPLLALALRRSLAQMTAMQSRACLAMRALVLGSLVLALAGPRFPWRSHEIAAVYVIDRSASVSPEAEKAAQEFVAKSLARRQPGDEAVLLGFAKSVASLPAAAVEKPAAPWPVQPERDATDIGKALAFAAAVFPEGKTKRAILLSDGNDTAGRAEAAAQALMGSGIELFAAPLQNPFRPETLVERLEIPASLREGEPFNAVATIRANVETACVARLYVNGFAAAEPQTVALKPGENTVTFRNLQPPQGAKKSTYKLEIAPEKDTRAENNSAQATAWQNGEPSTLIVDPNPEKMQPLVGALLAQRINAKAVPPAGLPKTLEEFQNYDAVLLSDSPSVNFSQEQMALCLQWVRDFGGGFAMLGGEHSFGLGGYFRTPIETLLPVRTDHDDATESPSVAILIILDSSGSMTAQVAGQTKISLACQGAALCLDVLQPRDLLGVMHVDTRVHQLATLARHENKAEVADQILRVVAGGGGIYIYTSLVEGFAQLREVNARIKHVILFSDSDDAEEKAYGEVSDGSKSPGNALDLVKQMAGEKITTSVIGLGSPADKDVPFLKQLAEAGNGKFYEVEDALKLPQIFTTETMRVAESSLVQEPFIVQPVHKSPLLDGIDWTQAPPLGGRNIVKLKPTSDLLLASENGDPVLATWRFGLGEVAAFTSDAKSRWASDWIAQPFFGKFWAQLVRSLLRRQGAAGGAGLQAAASAGEGGRLKVEIDAVAPDGAFRNDLPIAVAWRAPDGSQQSAPARQTAPGHYSAETAASISGTGATWISVQSPALPEGGALLGYTPPYPAEFLNSETNEAALERIAKIAGGKFNPQPQDVFARPAAGTPRLLDLTNWFLSAALLLLPVDVWLRRRSWS